MTQLSEAIFIGFYLWISGWSYDYRNGECECFPVKINWDKILHNYDNMKNFFKKDNMQHMQLTLGLHYNPGQNIWDKP